MTRSLAESHVHRGRLLGAKNDFTAARGYCEKLVAATEGPPTPAEFANWGDAETGLGALAEASGDRAGARTWFTSATTRYEKALTICPTDAAAKRGLAEVRAARAEAFPETAPPPRPRVPE